MMHSQKRFSLSRDQFGHPISGEKKISISIELVQDWMLKKIIIFRSFDTNSIEVFVDGKTLSMTFYETVKNPVYTLRQ